MKDCLLLKETYIQRLVVDHCRRSNIVMDDNTEITTEKITQAPQTFIQPNHQESLENKKILHKKNAEVFTPSWLCNVQNNLIDNQWFGKVNVFNKEYEKTWITNTAKIEFPKSKTWKEYVSLNRLEICCGEAPYLVSRYDSVTGAPIAIQDRIGLLDRKLRIINENTSSKRDWEKFSVIAFKSTYGYEKKGKNLLLARLNLFSTYIDYYVDRFGKDPNDSILLEISNIISWNLWQMDGLDPKAVETSQLMDWNQNKIVPFKTFLL